LSDSPELLKPNAEVTDSELQMAIGNLKAENETLRVDYDALLESSTHVTNKLRQEVQELRSQLEAQKTSWDELREELENSETIREELRSENSDLQKTFDKLRSELAEENQKSATASELPEAADLLNQLKARRKKSRADLGDVEAILGLLAEEDGSD
jgi:chromosome segregation ATPase